MRNRQKTASNSSLGSTSLYTRPSVLQRTSNYLSQLGDGGKIVYLRSKRSAGPFFWYLVAVGFLLILMVTLFASIERFLVNKVTYFHEQMRDRDVDKIINRITRSRQKADIAIDQIKIPDFAKFEPKINELDSFSKSLENLINGSLLTEKDVETTLANLNQRINDIKNSVNKLKATIDDLTKRDPIKNLQMAEQNFLKTLGNEESNHKNMSTVIKYKMFPKDSLIYIIGREDWTLEQPYRSKLVLQDVKDFDGKLIRIGEDKLVPNGRDVLKFREYLNKVFFGLSGQGQYLRVAKECTTGDEANGFLPRLQYNYQGKFKPLRIGIKIKKVLAIK